MGARARLHDMEGGIFPCMLYDIMYFCSNMNNRMASSASVDGRLSIELGSATGRVSPGTRPG